MPKWNGGLIVFTMFVCYMLESMFFQRKMFISTQVNLGIISTLLSAIYEKLMVVDLSGEYSFNIKNAAKDARKNSRTTAGEIINLLSTDVHIFAEFCASIGLIWSIPLQICVAVVIQWYLLGKAVFAFIGIVILVIIIEAVVSNFLKNFQLLKLHTWEKVFEKKLTDIRANELKSLKNFLYLNSSNLSVSLFVPNLVIFTTLAVYSRWIGHLDARRAFTSFAMFNVIQHELFLLPIIINLIAKNVVAVSRLEKFLKLPNRTPYVEKLISNDELPVRITCGSFKRHQNGNLVLENRSLTGIVGQVGSGKSTLLEAVMGNLLRVSGHVKIKGRLGYVPQQAWIINASLRDNILLGETYDEEKFNEVVNACALAEDILQLPAGDLTQIGEKGINLSGGQKQRVSLARSIYQDCDVYLFDDPLSAVDSHVATHIFDSLIGPHGMLKNKTRLLVTHAVNILPHVDQVVVLDGGCIVEQGTYQQLMDNGRYINKVLTSFEKIEHKLSKRNGDEQIEHRKMESDTGFNLTADYNNESTGTITWSTYNFYLKLLKYKWAFLAAGSFIAFKTFQIISYIWITNLAADKHLAELYDELRNESSHETFRSNTSHQTIFFNSDYINGVNHHLKVYGLLLLGHGIFVALYCIIRTNTLINASRRLHSSMIHRVIRSTMTFFYDVSAGRIINRQALHLDIFYLEVCLNIEKFMISNKVVLFLRFSKDLDAFDCTLADLFHQTFYLLTSLVGTLIVVSVMIPVFLFAAVLLLLLFLALQHFYLPTVCQLKWLSSNSRSPIYTHVCETVDGLASIKAFNKQKMFVRKFEELVNENIACECAINAADRWLGTNLELIGAALTLLAGIFFIISRDLLSGSIVGYCIAASINDSFTLSQFVMISSNIHITMVSLQRMKEYLHVDLEDYDDDDDEDDERCKDKKQADKKLSTVKPFKEGSIEFFNYSMKYKEGLDYALKNIHFSIKPSEKVGIMGRTGAGKSSLISALFRFGQSEGSIYIDNYDISKLPLKILRSNITVLSQDPFIFSDTIRMNLDPTSKLKESDAVIWKALEQVSLLHVIKSLPGQLDFFCEANGNNFSVGQRQLLCLARTLLHKTSILILDEATAAVDVETDKLIQSTISREFKDCTVIIIAHRMSSTASCDRGGFKNCHAWGYQDNVAASLFPGGIAVGLASCPFHTTNNFIFPALERTSGRSSELYFLRKQQ
ncbi:hypothetical protein HELRODRAFT_189203 [Helobdella robusta]|uniref:Uncharacterized protein n=1 Tax=Helobdella robusta TaxID=6412 RepID=T1FQS4_HELRO|nr:hypothetical protein HELRODRAFT_189203 [Helobdella robusta]ESN96339.1 hypothetical protein HELRODRAFT_189203 [Helobdella robusta]